MSEFFPRNHYYSFATTFSKSNSNVTQLSKNSFRWCGQAKDGTIKCETGTSPADARATFCARHGLPGGKCYGDPGQPPTAQQQGRSSSEKGLTHVLKSVLGNKDPKASPDPGMNPASGCPNCGNDGIAAIPCQIQKSLCEGGHGIQGGLGGNIPWTLVALGGGGLILLLILLKRR